MAKGQPKSRGQPIRRAGCCYRVDVVASPLPKAAQTDPVDFRAAAVPTPAHIVIVVEENRSQSNIIGNKAAPFINQLAADGAMMAQSFAEVHPSEPNYYALFAGNTLVKDNVCPVNAGNEPNLGSQLLAAGYSFVGFAESLPAPGSEDCRAGKYARKHVPWASFTNIPGSRSLPFSAFPARANYAGLPTVSMVIPNLDDDMHDGSIAQGDQWLYQNLSQYAAWAKANNSLLILTWDEDDNAVPQPDSDGVLRRERPTRYLQRADQPLQRAVHPGADVRAAQARLRRPGARRSPTSGAA